jgi:hypothetical protein
LSIGIIIERFAFFFHSTHRHRHRHSTFDSRLSRKREIYLRHLF